MNISKLGQIAVRSIFLFAIILVCFLSIPSAHAAQVEIYPGPGNDTYRSNLYSVEVLDGVNWVPTYVYKESETSNTHWHWGTTTSVNFLTFGTTASVSVRISKINGSISLADVSPKSKNIPAQITNGKAILTLKQNDKTWITLNGDDANPLFIFADAPKPAVPAGATYFGPGVYEIAPALGNHYQASDNEVIYLDGGAWVKGNIALEGASNVQVMGPGVLSGELWNSTATQQLPWDEFRKHFMIYGDAYSVLNTHSVKGVTIVNSPGYNVYHVAEVYSVKVLAPWNFQTDAFDAINIDQVFAFNGDTTFHLDTPYWSPNGGYNVNISITNSFAGNANNAVILGGYWSKPPGATFTSFIDNMDIRSYASNDWVPYGAPPTPAVIQIWVDNDDSSLGYSNQTYQNIRVEGNLDAPLAMVKNVIYPWPGAPSYDPPLGNSYDFVFKNITLEGTQNGLSEIKGYNENNGFHNVVFQDLKMNGTYVTDSNYANYFSTNPYVWGLSFEHLSPPSASFGASPQNIMPGSSSLLSWTTTNATSVSINNGVGPVSGNGTLSVSPSATTTYTLTATNSSGITTKQTTIVVDGVLPSTSITSPLNNQKVNKSSNVTILATASDNVGVTKVEFYVNNILKCTDTTASYSCVWNVPTGGGKVYKLQTKAFDGVGNSRLSTIVTVTSK